MTGAAAFEQCPCGGAVYAGCCGPLHDGEAARTAEALMRSRYAAYAKGRTDYLVRTWHPRTRPADLAPSASETWEGLEVLRTVAGEAHDDTGIVEFRASLRAAGVVRVLHEVSRFERRGGRWVYVDGDLGGGVAESAP